MGLPCPQLCPAPCRNATGVDSHSSSSLNRLLPTSFPTTIQPQFKVTWILPHTRISLTLPPVVLLQGKLYYPNFTDRAWSPDTLGKSCPRAHVCKWYSFDLNSVPLIPSSELFDKILPDIFPTIAAQIELKNAALPFGVCITKSYSSSLASVFSSLWNGIIDPFVAGFNNKVIHKQLCTGPLAHRKLSVIVKI